MSIIKRYLEISQKVLCPPHTAAGKLREAAKPARRRSSGGGLFERSLLVMLIVSTVSPVFLLDAMDIPLGGGAATAAGKSTGGFAVVDMAKVLDNFPETQKKEEELKKKIAEINAQIEEREKEIESLGLEIENAEKSQVVEKAAPELSMDGFVVLGSTESKQGPDSGGSSIEKSMTTAAGLSVKDLDEKRKELEEKKKELGDFRVESKKEINRLRKSFSQEVMGKIYYVLEDLAEEEGVEIVVDKDNVLYGRTEVDLTKKLIDRLSGKR